MNGVVDRQSVAEIAVMLALCAAAWGLIVRPQVRSWQALEEKIAEGKANPARAGSSSVEQMARLMDSVHGEVAEIARRNRLGGDASQVYGLVMSVAEESGVTVQRIDPRPGAAAEAEGPVRVAGFSMTVEGTYRHLADFLGGVAGIDGFVRPGSLSITPAGPEDDPRVVAQFGCDVLCFTIPDALASVTGEGDADP